MPVKVNYFSSFKRFDFGVPLEDIFPPNDINARLKCLFEEAYKLHISSGINIERVVRQLQGSLETRLELKERLIYDVHYDIYLEKFKETPGAYFWLIRHFLGLLPIPLLPTYSHEIHFDWIDLSEKCKNFLQHYESERERKYQLDYEFAENLNLLPFEHFLLLTILIHFIRKLSRNIGYGHINRRSLLFLCKYYCASTCVRPYTPGYKDEKMFPLFFYIVLRWREIEKYCRTIGHPAYFLEHNLSNKDTHANFSIRDNWAQTMSFTPSVITVYKNVPYFCDNNNYLKDTSCQTEQTEYADKSVQNLEQFENNKQKFDVKSKQEQLTDQESSSLYRLSDNSAPVGDDRPVIHVVTSSPIEDTNFVQDDKQSNNNFSFVSTEDSDTKTAWNDIVKGTEDTIKKVEEYIYDDYDTFSKEEYNQMSNTSKARGSFMNRISKMGWSPTSENKTGGENNRSLMRKVSRIGWTYTPEKSARKEEGNNETENSYIKYNDVFDENGAYKTNSTEEVNVKGSALNIIFKKENNSKTPLCSNVPLKSPNREDKSEGKSKNNFNLRIGFFEGFGT